MALERGELSVKDGCCAFKLVVFVIVLTGWAGWTVYDFFNPVPEGEHVRRPEYGFAVALPPGWNPTQMPHPSADLEIGGPVRVMTVSRPGHGSCEIDVWKGGDPSTLTGVAPAIVEHLAVARELDRVPSVTEISLPSGPSIWEDVYPRKGYADFYVMTGEDDRYYMLWCQDRYRHTDEWFAVAESFEFLPVGRSEPGQPPSRGRPFQTTDFAVRFPDEWTVDEVTPETHGWLYSKAGDDVRSWHGVAYAHDAEFSCAVIDTTGYAHELGFRTVDDAIAWELDAFTGYSDDSRSRVISWLTDDPDSVTSTMLDLPAGPAGAIDVTDEEWWNTRTYLLTDGERWFYLHCDDTFEPPDDDWLSIAETFEFLPADEQAAS